MATAKKKSTAPRKPRADAERNRLHLTDVAKKAFAERGADVTLDEIAKRAGVGIGTLYRHFPTRDAMLQAVYRHEVEQLAGAADALLERMKPLDALRAWLRLFVDYLGTKKIILPVLNAATSDNSALFDYSATQIRAAAERLITRAIEHGDVHQDVRPMDLLYAVFGFSTSNDPADWMPRAYRLIDILIAGLASADGPEGTSKRGKGARGAA
ncbi:TetR/AcrR family transcriptional regulator [Dyella monticola]|uniref:TetR/AcrR family transcriptional regulator n=1 Tax=Dyella monticola TaxID=1927958 RepID=UPI001E43107D|nr:TetR/AcrR family transcriptional regulator [Dyella monticola]